MGWVPWQRPGFDLGLQLERCLEENPGIRGIILGSHGLFTWGDTSYECYMNSLEVIEMASEYIERKIKEHGFGLWRTKRYLAPAPPKSVSEKGRSPDAAAARTLLRRKTV